MGWDAFGLPAENAAIERKVAPMAWTYENIATMKKQLQSIGLSLDWSREFATCDPGYYKHQQKMFLDFMRAGLAERENRKLNWDPVDMTVLANEQVIDGRGWRSGAVVEQREMSQWVFKITKYSEELLDALDHLDRWPDKVRLMQRNWIGRSEGLLIRFALDAATTPAGESELKIFTTRPDTLFGAKFMAISADHPLAQAAAAKNPELAAFIEEAKQEVAKRLESETRGNAAVGERQVNFRLRDWGISRQRYWGCPIPVIHCAKCDVVPVPASDLPVTLPDDATFDRPGNALDH